MLILSRRQGERIHVGENVVIEVIEQRGRKTRIGIHAPPDVKILREEITRLPEVEQRTAVHGNQT